jgi:hypothetical protein
MCTGGVDGIRRTGEDGRFVVNVAEVVSIDDLDVRGTIGRSGRHQGADGAGFYKPGDVENRLGYYLGKIAR